MPIATQKPRLFHGRDDFRTLLQLHPDDVELNARRVTSPYGLKPIPPRYSPFEIGKRTISIQRNIFAKDALTRRPVDYLSFEVCFSAEMGWDPIPFEIQFLEEYSDGRSAACNSEVCHGVPWHRIQEALAILESLER